VFFIVFLLNLQQFAKIRKRMENEKWNFQCFVAKKITFRFALSTGLLIIFSFVFHCFTENVKKF